jgi:methyl-accepting chemotaxis protein
MLISLIGVFIGVWGNSSKNLLLAGVITLIFGILIAWFINNSVFKVIDQLTQASEKISKGDFNQNDLRNIEKNKDEFEGLLHNFEKTSNTLHIFGSEINNMALQHDLGDIDVVIDEGKFQGEYKVMAKNINDMVQGHIKVKKKAMTCISEFANGNFEAELESFPGKKAFINENIEKLRFNIKEFIKEMDNMSKQHDLGDIDVVVNEENFQGAYRIIAKGVNDMVQGHIKVKKKAMTCISEFANGNFEAELESFPGKKAFINENIEDLRKNLKEVNHEINQLVEDAVNGKLDKRANTTLFKGDWEKLILGLNKLLEAVIEPVKEASDVLKEMANGNLKIHVKGDYKGDHGEIKDALNNTIDTLSSYVSEISQVLGEMSNSNLELSINNEYKGDFAQIKDALNFIIQSFNEVFTEINNAADQVSAGSNQVSDGSQALSQGTTEQASSIEELTSSITEVAVQTRQNAVNASQANELALNAKEGAILGNTHMKEMLKSMEEINESSSNISKIIKVIDDIAFQTNILALNAAVEAARAGQHGKGFAVVAEEVRNLAARSANAARETTDLIEGSIKKVEFGTKIANSTAESLDQIVVGVSKAATLVGEIAAASNEQATAISQINKGIEQVSDVVQTNSATAQESAAASEELSSQASVLKNMIAKFRLKTDVSVFYNDVSLRSQRNLNHVKSKSLAYDEVAVTKNKPRISLNDMEFGKY